MTLKRMSVLTAIVVLTVASPAGATDYHTPNRGWLSATGSPFSGCTSDSGQTGTVYPRSEVEPHVAVNPSNPRHLIAAWQQDRWSNAGARGLMVAVSRDGGVTWNRRVVPGLTLCSGGTFQRASDPWVSFGPRGRVYLASIGLRSSGTILSMRVSVSRDGGASWDGARTVIDDGLYHDKETITADPRNADVAYLAWHRLAYGKGPIWFSKTTNGGRDWTTPRQIFDPGLGKAATGNQIFVMPNGDLVHTFALSDDYRVGGPRDFSTLRSTDGGATWGRFHNVMPMLEERAYDPDTGARIEAGNQLPEVTMDATPTSPGYGRLYAVWATGRFSGGVYADVSFTMSMDGGRTWTSPVKVNKTPSTVAPARRQALTPQVAVATDGTIGVTYYDFRRETSGSGLMTDYWFVHCHFGTGCTNPSSWTEAKVNGDAFDIRRAPVTTGRFLGDYQGLAASGTTFVPVWSQSSSYDPAQVWWGQVAPDVTAPEHPMRALS